MKKFAKFTLEFLEGAIAGYVIGSAFAKTYAKYETWKWNKQFKWNLENPELISIPDFLSHSDSVD